ncbi:hypothetical protein USDA257_c51110 [Sinorhizobium fredii USDA 257]|uniref:Uncharacterized protein n=1 Tax=Sinorhizobium fredii (strain USDA 257) TaxID=1185652 RepID=I3XCN1_SINF2|nr:hypothetical protein USDA257_c51110 [Sinorhizobium fredii USDA 257]
MGDLVRHLTMSPECQKQRTHSLPGAKFPEQVIDRCGKGINNQ